MDAVQFHLAALPPAECPVQHRFTPGLYAREIFMPAGAMVVSRVHKTEHPYVVLSGRALVYVEGIGVADLRAGHVGITTPGTRRVLYMVEDTRWITFHPTPETDLEKLQEELTETPDVSYVGDSADAQEPEIFQQLRDAAARLQLLNEAL